MCGKEGSATYHGLACAMSEIMKSSRNSGGAVGKGRKNSGRNHFVHLQKFSNRRGPSLRRTHSMTTLRTRREEQRAPGDARPARKTMPHVRRQRSHGSSASRIFQIFHASPSEKRSPHRALDLNSPPTTMSSTLHPEVLWAQRSSETDETKVRRRGHPHPAIEGA